MQKIKEQEGEGCNVYGSLEVNKVAGNFHFAPGKSFHQSNVHVHDMQVFGKDSFNVSTATSHGADFPSICFSHHNSSKAFCICVGKP